MVGDNIGHLTSEDGKDSFLGGDDGTFIAVAASEVLAGHDRPSADLTSKILL